MFEIYYKDCLALVTVFNFIFSIQSTCLYSKSKLTLKTYSKNSLHNDGNKIITLMKVLLIPNCSKSVCLSGECILSQYHGV